MITLSQITQLALIGTPEATAQAKVLFALLNADTAQAFDETAKAIDKLKEAKADYKKPGQTYAEKVAAHSALKAAKNLTKGDKKIIAQAAKAKAKDSKGSRGEASQARNNHSKAKIKGKKNGQTVPDLIIEWFGRKKAEKTIAQISEGTGLTNKEIGDACWNQVKKGTMVSTVVGKYGMA